MFNPVCVKSKEIARQIEVHVIEVKSERGEKAMWGNFTSKFWTEKNARIGPKIRKMTELIA